MTISIKTIRVSITLLSLIFLFNANIFAQCKSEIKEGIEKLEPYTHNGQVNNATLSNGKPVEVHLSFYKGLRYKLQIVSDPAVGPIHFKILTEDKEQIYDSNDEPENPGAWDFLSTSAQELIIEITSTDNTKTGCIAVLVGIKPGKATSNPIRNL